MGLIGCESRKSAELVTRKDLVVIVALAAFD
jgi:hypothetical protein